MPGGGVPARRIGGWRIDRCRHDARLSPEFGAHRGGRAGRRKVAGQRGGRRGRDCPGAIRGRRRVRRRIGRRPVGDPSGELVAAREPCTARRKRRSGAAVRRTCSRARWPRCPTAIRYPAPMAAPAPGIAGSCADERAGHRAHHRPGAAAAAALSVAACAAPPMAVCAIIAAVRIVGTKLLEAPVGRPGITATRGPDRDGHATGQRRPRRRRRTPSIERSSPDSPRDKLSGHCCVGADGKGVHALRQHRNPGPAATLDIREIPGRFGAVVPEGYGGRGRG